MTSKGIKELTENWEFRKVGDVNWLKAIVPGCVHTDLYKNGKIEDPFFRTNAKTLQWIEEEDWEYRLKFNISDKTLVKDVVELQFDGLDTFATICLNGIQLIETDNMFHSWSVNCKEHIQKGYNELVITFHSPYNRGLKLLNNYGFQLPANNETRHKKVSPYIRKAPYHFGWDWGPRLVTSGIWKSVYVNYWDTARLENVHIIQENITNSVANINAVFEINSTQNSKATITIYNNGNTLAESIINIKEGITKHKVPFNIDNPELWWPNGLGKPHLYNIKCKLSINNKTIDEISEDIGIRTIELITKPDEHGSGFLFKVNGKEVFIKGANIIPFDYFPAEVSKHSYDFMVNSAVDANFNMLRAWGGAFYEDDYFYRLCNKKGLLVWQDFMYACGMYPANDEFIKNIETETIYTIKRLRNHACLALWCGNNELTEAFHTWGWKEDLGKNANNAWVDYKKVFNDVLPSIIKEHSPQIQYWPSSPGDGSNDAPTLTSGDYHYWDIIKDDIPISAYNENVGRFMSEYGFKGYPELKTLNSYSKESDWDIRSEVMKYHDGWERGADLIETNMNREYGKPKDFRTFLYVSQVLQAEAMKVAIEAHRRNKPYCMGTLYWQLNDVWPTASWSSIDYFGRWKALHYFVKKLYKEFMISIVVNDNQVSFCVNSDRQTPTDATLNIQLLDFSGHCIWKSNQNIEIEANSNKCYLKDDIITVLKNYSRKDCFIYATIYEGETILADNFFYFLPIKDINLPKPLITFKISKNKTGYNIELTTNILAKNVYLHLSKSEGFFSDNYFDMLPNSSVKIDLVTNIDEDTLKEELITTNIYNAYN